MIEKDTQMAREGRGGNWNRAGRRGGGPRTPVIYAPPRMPRCGVPDCPEISTHRVDVIDGPPVGVCDEHAAALAAWERKEKGSPHGD